MWVHPDRIEPNDLEMFTFVEGGKPKNSEKTVDARPEPTTNHMWSDFLY